MPKALVLGGATGLLGQALIEVLSEKGWEARSLGRQDGDLLNSDFIRKNLEILQPDVVFNTVAWTQVDDAEDYPKEALAINRCMPDLLARTISTMPPIRLVHFSTDFVFSGVHQGAWKETDIPNPDSVYGDTKLAGEKAVMSVLPDRSCVIRTAWLFGPGRKNFVTTILDASRKKDVLNVVDDQYGSPTYTPDLAKWSVELAEKGASGLWHGVNSGHATWCELATEAVHLIPSTCRVIPITSADWPQKAKRPINSCLDNTKLADFLGYKPRPWPKALRDFIYSQYGSLQEPLP